MSQHEEYTSPPGFRISGAGGTKLAPVLIDPAAPASEGDVITRIGASYAPRAPGVGVGFAIKRSAFTTDDTYQTVDFPNSGAYTDLWSDDPDPALPPAGWTFNAGRDGLLVPVDGRYLITEIVTWNQHATDWQAALVSPTGPSASTGVVPPATVLDLSSLGVSAAHTQEIKRLAGQTVVFELQTAGGIPSVVVYGMCQYLGPLPA
jgi:hypothetical protein